MSADALEIAISNVHMQLVLARFYTSHQLSKAKKNCSTTEWESPGMFDNILYHKGEDGISCRDVFAHSNVSSATMLAMTRQLRFGQSSL